MKLTAKNKAFWALKRAEQRVEVAQDTLLQIEAGKLYARTGTYLSFVYNGLIVEKKLDKVFSELRKAGSRCTVCGIGACFYGMVNKGNNVTTEIAAGDFRIKNISDGSMRVHLEKIFTKDQLALIEASFECSTGFGLGTTNSNTLEKAVEFGRKYSNDQSRLKGIMQNIINNHGYFRP